jgi:outer membrane protein assembly factor BamE
MRTFADAEMQKCYLCGCIRLAANSYRTARGGADSDMIDPIRIVRGFSLALALGTGLGACSYLPTMPTLSSFKPYHIDVQQGNVTTQEMVSSLKPGMSKDQVKFILGTPLLNDMFHPDRWDYVYRLQQGNGILVERRFTLYFEKDVLARIEGDVVPQPGVATSATPIPAVTDKPAVGKDQPGAGAPASGDKPTDPQTADATDAKPPEQKKGFFARLREKLGL